MKGLFYKALWVVVGAPPWKKIFKAAAAVFLLIGAFYIWDYCDFAYTRGAADPKEMAREEKLWKLTADIYNAHDDYYTTKVKAIEERISKRKKYRTLYSADYFKFMPLDTVKIGKSSARCMADYIRYKQRLRHFSDDEIFGYRDAALTCCEISAKNFMSDLVKDEMLFNAQSFFKRESCDSEALKKYYELYNKENKDEAFKYTDAISLDDQNNFLPMAMQNGYFFCAKEHAGYRLWQGCSPASVSADLKAAAGDNNSDINTKGPARIRCLERRLQRGSKYAAFCLPAARRFSPIFLAQKYTVFLWKLYVTLLQAHLDANRVLDVLHLDDKYSIHNYNFPQTADEKWWRITNNLALSTDNYLTFVKYSVNHKPNSGRPGHVLIMPKYGRNSAEMKLFGENLAAELQYSRRKLNSAELAGVPRRRQAGLEFCGVCEEILHTCERYRQGQYDYKKFCRTLKKNESDYENKRRELLSLRWDYMFKHIDDGFVYVCLSLYADGVPTTAVESVKKAKLSE